ncbi:unnamed protein product [Heterobilharzia americana]|nr:unnamed protein product [Heterobilharzia americana]
MTNHIIFVLKRLFKALLLVGLFKTLSYRSVGVKILEQKSRFVIPGLTKEDAEHLKLERKNQSQCDTVTLNSIPKKKKSKKPKSKQTEFSEPQQKTILDSKEPSKQILSANAVDHTHVEVSGEPTITVDRKLKREQKRLLQIEDIERKKLAGEKLNKDQHEKLSHKRDVEKLIEELKSLKTD